MTAEVLENKPIRPEIIIEVKYILYARKSTEQDEKQALSIDSQIKEMRELALRKNLNIVDVLKESHSAKDANQRPVFNEMILGIKSGKYTGIITWAPDRISRNAGDLGVVVDLFDQGKLINIETHSQSFSNNPNEKFLLMILGSQAKLENDNKRINVKRGLKARCEMGLRPSKPPVGYRNVNDRLAKCEVELDPDRYHIIRQLFEKIAYDKWSGRKVYAWLKYDIKFKTLNDYSISAGNVFKILHNTFYYGYFEYPVGSGKWYKGVHEPIITKELFDLANESIKSQIIKSEGKEFAFTKMIKCGLCGSGITADEKFKKLKSGGVNRHVYYRCTKAKDVKCKNPAINETNLLKEFQKLSTKLEMDEIILNKKVNQEIKKFKKLQAMFLGKENKSTIQKVDLRDYIKFILKDGTILEKREILDSLKGKLILKDREIFLEK